MGGLSTDVLVLRLVMFIIHGLVKVIEHSSLYNLFSKHTCTSLESAAREERRVKAARRLVSLLHFGGGLPLDMSDAGDGSAKRQSSTMA
jgi:hypothetical protein